MRFRINFFRCMINFLKFESATGSRNANVCTSKQPYLHPVVFGGILGKRDDAAHLDDMQQFAIPEIDLVIVDLYPFEETLQSTSNFIARKKIIHLITQNARSNFKNESRVELTRVPMLKSSSSLQSLLNLGCSTSSN